MNPQDALIVANRPEVSHPLEGILARYPLKVRIVHSAEQALATMSDCQPDLLFVDLALPGTMDGWELLYTLQKARWLNDRLVIALTAHEVDGIQEAALAEGFAAFFPMPIDESRFVPVFEQIVRFS